MGSNRPKSRLVWVLVCFLSSASLAADAIPGSVSSVVKERCIDCHQGTDASAGLDLTRLEWKLDDIKNRSTWISIHDRVEKGEMPPEEKLPESERRQLLSPLHNDLFKTILEEQRRDGRTRMRRLTRREFERSVQDLLGVQVPLQFLLPADSRAQGFDTVTSSQHVSAIQVEKTLEAIDAALDAAFRLTARPELFQKRFYLKDEKEIRENLDKPENEVDPISGSKHKRLFEETDNAIVFISHGYSPDNIRQFSPTADGIYRIRISGYAVRNGSEPVAMRVHTSDWKSNRLIGYFEMLPNQPRVVELTIPMTVRDHLRINGYNIGIDASGKSVWNVDTIQGWNVPGLAVEWVEVEGPIVDTWPPKSLQELVGAENIRKLKQHGGWTEQGMIEYEIAADDAEATAAEIIDRFATRAFRRALKHGESEPYIDLAKKQLKAGAKLERALRVAFRAILVSPQFLYFEENAGTLDNEAIANRLSYFLTSTFPDTELRALAREGKLTQRDVLRQQADRLLRSLKSQAFVQSFVAQWLELDQLDATAPDMRLYPEYDELLRSSMVTEAEQFFRELLDNDLPASNAIDSNFVMIDRRLSVHYGITIEPSQADGLFGEQFRKVQLPPDHTRGGVITQAGVLKVTANGTLTSPVRRGAWVLKQILGTPPPPPPPVPAIEPDTRGATTIRQQLDKHRTSMTCNRCHRQIDPPGFALESFDVIGGYRERYRSIEKGDPAGTKWQGRDIWEYRIALPVECSGTTESGQDFADIREFKKLLSANEKQFIRNLAGQLITYSTGANLSFADRREVDDIVDKVSSRGGGLRSLILEIVESEIFRNK